MVPSSDMASHPPPYGYGYPSMQSAYQQAPALDSSPSHGGYNPGYEQYSQVGDQTRPIVHRMCSRGN